MRREAELYSVFLRLGELSKGLTTFARFPIADVEVDRGRPNVGVAHQDLNGVQINAGFEQMRREAVAQGVAGCRLSEVRLALSAL